MKKILKKVFTEKDVLGISFLKRNPSLFVINYIYQRIFRLDSDCRFLKHFSSRVMNSQNIKIENDSYKTLKSFFASGGCFFQGAKGIIIGFGIFWSVNVVMMSSTYDLENYKPKEINKPIILGKNCWIGANVVIMPEVELGAHTIVGAGSVVTKSFPDGNCVIAGVPARIIRKLSHISDNYL
jgi:acetyltransferase-like isoleucine patch superfamily enzyme